MAFDWDDDRALREPLPWRPDNAGVAELRSERRYIGMGVTIHDIMTPSVVTVTSDTTVDRMRQLLAGVGVHHLSVWDRGRVVGVVSDRDLLRHLSPWAGTMGETRSDAATLKKRAHQVMTRKLVSTTPDTNIVEAIGLMLDSLVSCLPVLDERGGCAGIVTWRDILRWTAERLESDGDDLRDAA